MEQPFSNLRLVAQQGSGKTLAYLLPVLQKINTSKNVTQAICVVVSYEAAVQTVNWLASIAVFLEKPVQIGIAVQKKGIDKIHLIVLNQNTFISFNE